MFMARLMSTYIPEILTRELDLYATSDPDKWQKMRSLFTGRDPVSAERMNEEVNTMLGAILTHVREFLPDAPEAVHQARSEFTQGVEYGRQLLVRYFENRPEIPSVKPESSEPIDPHQMAAEFLRSLGWPPQ